MTRKQFCDGVILMIVILTMLTAMAAGIYVGGLTETERAIVKFDYYRGNM